MRVQRCKGMRDLLPRDMARFREIETRFRESCLGWGYEEIRTPTLEYLHLFTSAGTLSPDMLGRVYSFLDWDGWSGERVALRPDGTIPAARLYVENFRDRPVVKMFYIANTFAFESSGAESRERWQCGAELIGGTRPQGDVELICLALECLNGVAGPVEIRLAHAGVLKAFLEGLGLRGEDEAAVMEQVFSGDTGAVGRAAGGSEVDRYAHLLFGLKGESAGFVENLRSACVPSFPALGPGLDELECIAGMLTDAGFEYRIDLTSGRGFEYYTGIIFEFYAGGQRLGGGGRYDELVPLVGGQRACASGFALYMDRIIDLVKEPRRRRRVLLRTGADETLRACVETARLLRKNGFIAEFDLGHGQDAFDWTVKVNPDGGFEVRHASGSKEKLGPDTARLLDFLGGPA
ncbi:MAG: histidine--tRNA ligase family protein [Dehalococcoidia bacterium]|nr:histidine--tRNA ligase family protein [Dehalococcoidia bacterium]